MKNKGFTTVELIVSFTLTTIIVIFLFELIFVLKDLYVSSGIKMKLLTKEANINSVINDDIAIKTLSSASKIDNSTVRFCFKDNTCKELSFDKVNKRITYDNYATKLVDGSKFGNIIIKTETFLYTDNLETLNSILTIKIPVYHSLFEKEDFGVNITYLYNSNTTSMSGLNLTDIVEGEKTIQLLGTNQDFVSIGFKGLEYNDPGYMVIEKNNSVLNDPNVEVTGSVDSSRLGNYYLTYTLYDMNHNIMDQKVRIVNIINSEYVFDYTGDKQTFNIPISGTYKVQLWGASGGGISTMSGKGGYTDANFKFTSDDILNIYVGGTGSLSSASESALGGYNGGGNSGSSLENFAGSGGGATDIRLNSELLQDRILIAGGGGGAGSRNDSSYTCNGGSGGGENGTIGECSSDEYLGEGGTQTSGGSKAIYSTNMVTLPTDGIKGVGGIGGSYSSSGTTYASGGGGGGYYGGGGGSRYGGGGGGSGYCSTSTKCTSCTTLNGGNLFEKPTDNDYEKGHAGNGYVKISLVSID